MQRQPLPAARFLLRMDKRGALVAVHRLPDLVGIPAHLHASAYCLLSLVGNPAAHTRLSVKAGAESLAAKLFRLHP